MTNTEISKRLVDFEGWELDPEQNLIATAMEFEDFEQAIGFVEAIAELVEELKIYPDIFIHDTRFVQVMVSSENVTEEDFELIEAVEEMIATVSKLEESEHNHK